MQFQEHHSTRFDIAIAWQDTDAVQFKITRHTGQEQHTQTFVFAPEELERLTEYIQDQLCL
jgi:hypothetical protein